MEILLAIIMGGLFGMVLQRIGATNPTRILDMLQLVDLKLMKTIMFGIGLATLTVFIVNALFVDTVHFSVKAAYLGVLIGGMIFGIGFAVAGYCPGTSMAALGEGRIDAIFFILGGLVGAMIFALVFDAIKTTAIYTWTFVDAGKASLAADVARNGREYAHLIDFLPGVVTGIIMAAIFIFIAAKVPNSFRQVK